MDQFDINLDVF